MALSMGGAETMSETGKPVEEDFSGIPLVERVDHKNFKARQSAYVELITKFSRTGSDDDPIFRVYSNGDMLKRWVTDTHAVAQEKGVEAAISLVQNSGESSARTRSEVLPAVEDKCLGASRAQTKTKAIELALMYVEVENGGEGVVNDILRGLDAKAPKAVAGAVQCLKDIVSAFGVRALGDIKPLTGSLPKMFDHKDKLVREQATLLCQALYRYLGPVLPPLLAELKPAQLKDLQVKFDEMDAAGENGKCVPPRLTRKTAREKESREALASASVGAGGGGEGAAAAEEEEIDPLSMVEAVNIVSKIPENFLTEISATKWSDKVNTCGEMKAEVVKFPKIQNSPDLAPYIEALAAKLKESHAAVIAAAVGILTELAKRIEDKGFGKYKTVVFSAAMLKFTEKRAIPILAQLLDDTFACCELSDVIEECAIQSKNKAAAVKENTMAFLVRCLCSSKHAPRKDDVKPIVDICIGALGDAAGPTRQQGVNGLAALQKIVGERVINSFLEDVSELQKKLVAEAVATIEVKYKPGATPAPTARPGPASTTAAPPMRKPTTKPAARAALSARPTPTASTSTSDDMANDSDPVPTPGHYRDFMDDPNAFPTGEEAGAKQRAAPPARLAANFAPRKPDGAAAKAGPPTRTAAPSKAPAAGSNAAPPSVSGPEAVAYKHSPEEAVTIAEAAIPAEMRTMYSSAAWKERITALEDMTAWLKEGPGKAVEAEVIARFFEKPLTGSEKLIQVTVKIFELFHAMAEHCFSFGKAAASLVIGPMADKIGDLKAKKVVSDALILFSEKISLGFVLSQAFQPMIKLKVAKAQTEAIGWVKQALTDFGLIGVDIKDLVSFLKIGLQNSQAAVRAAAIEALVVVKLFIGSDVLSFLEDLNPQLLATITSEFEKANGQTAPVPTRKSAGLPVAGAGGKGKAGGDPLDQLVPRVDLDKLVKETTFVADCRSDSFKERKAGADALLATLEIKANSRLKPNMGEAGIALKGRMGDSNLGVKMTCLTIISRIATGMGAGFSPHAKLLTPPIALLLCDQKAMTRNAALETLSTIATACEGVESMIPGLATAMESPNSVARGLIGNFIFGVLKEKSPSRGTDLTPLMQPIFLSLEDKIAEARKAATLLLPFVIANVGFNALTDKAASLKPASRATVTSALQAAKAAGLPASRSEEKVSVSTQASQPALVAKPTPAAKQMQASSAPASMAGTSVVTAMRAGSMATKVNALRPLAGMIADSGDIHSLASKVPQPNRVKARVTVAPAGPSASVVTALRGPMGLSKPATSDRAAPFITMDLDPKQQRAKRDATRWSLETQTPAQLLEYLQKQMDGHATPDLMQLLFSADRMAEKDHMAGLASLDDFFSPETSFYGLPVDSMKALRLANSDITVKYAALRMHDGSTQMINGCLELLANVVHVVDDAGGAGFNDTETNVLLPALIAKLGDKKFADRLGSIFAVIDRAVPASKVLQYYVEYGVGSSNSKTRATALENLAQLIRRRGDVAASSSAGPRLYKRIAEQIGSADGASRSGALDCMAFLYKHTGESVQSLVADLRPKDRDMLNNRIEKMAAAPALRAVQASGPPARVMLGRAPTTPSRGSNERNFPASSPSPESSGRSVGAGRLRPTSGTAKSNNSSPPSDGSHSTPSRSIAGRSRMPQPRAILRNEGLSSAQPPLAGASIAAGGSLMETISSVTSPDPDASVDALKHLRHVLEDTPTAINGHGDELISVVTVQFRRILSRRDGLQDPKLFRLLKHLVETLSNLCENEGLIYKLGVNAMRDLLDQLTLGLIGTDTSTDPMVRDMSRHLNNIIVRFFGLGRRSVVFESLFTLFQQIAIDFDPMTMESAIETRHAELVLKCIWKRSRSSEDDLVKGLLDPKDVFRILENFLQAIPPRDWRLRATQKVPLGDMPLRTIKVLIQHIGTKCGTIVAVEKLHEAFGDRAEDTIVYEYVYRIIKLQQANADAINGENAEAGPSRPPSQARADKSQGHVSGRGASPAEAAAVSIRLPASPQVPQTPIGDDLDGELDGLIKQALSASGLNAGIPLLYDFLRAHPDKREKFEQMLDLSLGADPRYKLFIKRKLDRLESENQPVVPAGNDNAVLAQARDPFTRQAAPLAANLRHQSNRGSTGPRPTIPADVDDDTRLALLKDKFQFFAQTGATD